MRFIRFARDNYRNGEKQYWLEESFEEMLSRSNVYQRASEAASPVRALISMAGMRGTQSGATRFGNTLEAIAHIILGTVPIESAMFDGSGKLVGLSKSAAEGLDIDIERGGYRYLISVKSVGHSDNSRSKKRQDELFSAALERTGTGAPSGECKRSRKSPVVVIRNPEESGLPVITVTAIAYGRAGKKNKAGKGAMIRLAGQAAWWFLTGDSSFYLKLCRIFNEDSVKFENELAEIKRGFRERVLEIMRRDYARSDGLLDWEKIVKQTCECDFDKVKNWYPHLDKVDTWFRSPEGRRWRALRVADTGE